MADRLLDCITSLLGSTPPILLVWVREEVGDKNNGWVTKITCGVGCLTRNNDESTARLDNVNQNGTLEITETRKRDAGSYTCLVTNTVGRSALTATLTVRGNFY